MSNLESVGVCPYCDNGHKTGCFAMYTDGYKCHSCHKYKSYSNHYMTVMGRSRVHIKIGITLPTFTKKVSRFSVIALKGLYDYYVFDDLIYKYNIGYIESKGELMFPVIKDNEIVFAQTRSYPGKRIRGRGEKKLFKISNGSKDVVIVEDYISAIRLGELNIDAICLFGTYINNSEIPSILDKYNTIRLWFDSDAAGDKARKLIPEQFSKKIKENKSRFPLKYMEEWSIIIINSEKDPKSYSDKELEERLWV